MTNNKDKRRTEHVIKMDDQSLYTMFAESRPRKDAKEWFDSPAYGKHPVRKETDGNG